MCRPHGDWRAVAVAPGEELRGAAAPAEERGREEGEERERRSELLLFIWPVTSQVLGPYLTNGGSVVEVPHLGVKG